MADETTSVPLQTTVESHVRDSFRREAKARGFTASTLLRVLIYDFMKNEVRQPVRLIGFEDNPFREFSSKVMSASKQDQP